MTNKNKLECDLCGHVCEVVTDKYGGHTPAGDYPEAERNVVIIWTISGIIENGGFHYVFESILPGDPDWVFTIAAFERVGCQKAAQTIREAIHLFPNCKPPLDNEQRIRWFEKQPEKTRNRLDTEFWNELDNITVALAKYIRDTKLDKIYHADVM